MNTPLLARILLTTAGLVPGFASTQALALEDPFVELSLADASARAEKAGKLILLYFHNDDESACKRMVNTTWADEHVLRWLEDNAIAVRVPPSEGRTYNRFGVTVSPHILFLEGDSQKVLHMMKGFQSAIDFMIGSSAATATGSDGTAPEGEALENPMAWLAWGNWLFTNAPGRHSECLDAYLWCLDNGEEYLHGFRERHFEFLCQRIAWLRNLNQAAADALYLRRERTKSAILAAVATPSEINDYIRYSFWLRDEFHVLETVEEMRDLGEKHDPIARVLIRAELNRAVARELYADILPLDPAPLEMTKARLIALYESTPEDDRTKGSPFMIERGDIVFSASCYFEALLGTDRAGDAMELMEYVTDQVSTGRAFFTFMERTNRLRAFELTHRIAERGMKMVSAKGQKPIQTELKKIQVLKNLDARRNLEEKSSEDGDQR